MTIRLDHTIVPAKDKVASAKFFAEIFGLTVEPDPGHFAGVQVNESLTLDFADEPEEWGGPGFDQDGASHHYAFHVSDAEFDAIFGRVKAKGISYGSGPFSHTNGRINTRRSGRGVYFEDPYGHLLEIMTVPETAGAPAGRDGLPPDQERWSLPSSGPRHARQPPRRLKRLDDFFDGHFQVGAARGAWFRARLRLFRVERSYAAWAMPRTGTVSTFATT